MKVRISGGTFLASVIIACVAWLAFYARGAVAREANALMEAQVSRGFFSGAVLISRNGKVLFEHAYGMANAEAKIPNTLATRFRIGSISKTFTAILIMQLEGEQRLALTDPVCKYLDECRPDWAAIGVHHLLSQTSGIPNYQRRKTGETETVEEMLARPPAPGEDFARFVDEPPGFAPGSKFEYSNSNYRLLAHIVAKLTGQSFEEALRARILVPAGMHDTGFSHDWPATPHAAVGYWMTRQGKTERAPIVDGGWSSGDGGLYSTVLDLQKFSDALDRGVLISRATLDRTLSPVHDGYGYGWEIPGKSHLTLHRRQVGHGGAMPGFLSQFRRFEDEKVTLIALSNKQALPLTQVVQALASAAFDEPFTPSYQRETVDVPDAILQRYTGDYELDGRVFTFLVRDGHVYVKPKDGGGPEIALLAASEDVFFVKDSDGDITIVRDAGGKVIGVTASFGDRALFAKKLH